MEQDLRLLSMPLPEDIAKLKWGGDFETALRVIEKRIACGRTPEVMKARLRLEKELLCRIPEQYPYGFETALSMLCERIEGFSEAELRELWEENACEWIYKNGRVFFHEQFFDNLIKVRGEYARRLKTPQEADPNRELLVENIIRAKENGARKVHFHLRTTIRLTEEGKKKCMGKDIRVYLPLPIEEAQVRNYRLLRIEPVPKAVSGPHYPQRTAVMELRYTGKETFSAEFEFDNIVDYTEPDPEKVLSAQPHFYTEEEAPHIRFTPYIRALLKEITGDEENPLLKAQKIYDYITTHVSYSYVRSYSTVYDIPEYTGSSLKGDCGFQALLFITLCRAAGIPAKWQSGLYATPYYVGSHDWAQYYVAPYGWLFADCSFGGSGFRQQDEAKRLFYRANLDPYRVPQASEFQHPFMLKENAVRFDPYDNQAGEIICEGKALSAYGKDFETVYEMIELTEVL